MLFDYFTIINISVFVSINYFPMLKCTETKSPFNSDCIGITLIPPMHYTYIVDSVLLELL